MICSKCKVNPALPYHRWCKSCKATMLKAWRKLKPWKERYISVNTVLKLLKEKPTTEVIELLKRRITKPLPKGVNL